MIEYLSMRKIYLGDLPEIEEQLGADIAAVKSADIFYPVVVVVPSNLAGVYLRRALVRHSGSYCGVRFLTTADLAAGLAEKDEGYLQRRVLPPFGERWLAALVAREAAGGYFGPVAGSPGFCEALRQTFQELENAGLEQLPSLPGGDPRRTAELRRLYALYRKLSSPFAGGEAVFKAALLSVPADPFMLALYGIYQLSAFEKKLLAALAEHSGAAVYWQRSAASFAPTKELLHWFEEQGFTAEPLALRERSTNLAVLQQHLFQHPPADSASREADESLQFICAPDEIGEVEEITREIISLARGGLRFGEMAVLSPGRTYAGLLRENLAAAGVPCYLAGGLPLAQTRTGRSFLLLLKLAGGDYPRQKVMELLSDGPFDYRRVLGSVEEVSPALWDRLSAEAGVIKGRRQWRESLERYRRRLQAVPQAAPEAGEKRSLEELLQVELLLDFLGKFFGAMDRFQGARSWGDLTAAAAALVERFFYPGEEREVLRQLLKKLQRLDECGGEFMFKPALELLQSALQSASLPRGKFQQEGVNLVPLSAAAGLSFTALFIPGLVERSIPAPAKPDPLLPETERLALSGKLPLRRHKLAQEALRFILALGGATKKVVLSWPRVSAAAGREQLPSFYLSRCGEALCAARPGHDQLFRLPGYRYIAALSERGSVTEPVTAAEYDLGCSLSLPPGQRLPYFRALAPVLSSLLSADAARFGRLWSAHDGVFSRRDPGETPLLLPDRTAFSATALEDYARCPYSYFLKRLLKLGSLEEPEELLRITPLTRGRLLHRILEDFYRGAAAEGLLPVRRFPGRCRLLLQRISHEEFAAVPPEERPPYPLLWRLQIRVLEETVQALLTWEIEAEEDFIPVDFEVAFGFSRDGGAPVSLELPSGETVSFRGRIDRVDRSGSAVRVIDYKTGKRRAKDNSLAGGEALQLPIYLLAAAALYGWQKPGDAEAYSYHLSPEGVETVLFSGDSWSQQEELLKEAVEIIYEGIRAGRFFPYPGRNCRYCEYAAICGPDIERNYRLKAADPVLDLFLRLKESSS